MPEAILSASGIYRLLVVGGCWLSLLAVWAAACVWIDRDARYVFGSGTPWTLLMALLGPCLLLATLLRGFVGQPIFLLALAIISGAYLRLRESRVAPAHRVLTATHARKLLRAAVAWLRGGRAFVALRDGDSTHPRRRDDLGGVILLRQDGTPLPAAAGGGRRRGMARAMQSARDMIAEALTAGATDIHLEPMADGNVRTRFRIDGVMKTVPRDDGAAGQRLIDALTTLAGVSTSRHGRREGGFLADVAGRTIAIRATIHPTGHGERLDMAVQNPAAAGIGPDVHDGLDGIGLPAAMCESLRSIIQLPYGMLVVCGPPQSGKTTTAYATIGDIDPLVHRLATVEDSLAHELPNVAQSALNPAAAMAAATLLRDLLREPPDAIMVDEIRDRETAEAAVQAASVCTVVATMQADGAADAVRRLLAYEIAPTALRALAGVLALRLVRVLCDHCKAPCPPPPDFLKKLDQSDGNEITIFKKKGCPACHGTGYSGRIPVPELLLLDDSLRAILSGRPSLRRIRGQARRAGMRTMREAAIELVRQGVTSIKEVVRVVP